MSYRRFLLVLVLTALVVVMYGSVVCAWRDYSATQNDQGIETVMIGKEAYHITSYKQPNDSVDILEIETTGTQGCNIRCAGDAKIVVVQKDTAQEKKIGARCPLGMCIGVSMTFLSLGTMILMVALFFAFDRCFKRDENGHLDEKTEKLIWNIELTLLTIVGIGLIVLFASL